jgi:hypothetical protein
MATWKGAWLDNGSGQSNITYYEGEFVNYGNIVYIATSTVLLGSAPPPSDMDHWDILVAGVMGTSGTSGLTGASGTSGTSGPGVSTGGTSGQILSKIDGTNYNTQWIDAPSGGSISNNISINTLSYNDGTLGTAGVVGEVAYFGGGTGLTAGNLVYLSNTGAWVNADADATSTSTGLLGISIGTAGTAGVLLRGHARFTGNASYTGMTTIGAQLYVSSTTGAFTQTAPSAAGRVVRIIGYVTDTTQDKFYFCPDTTWIQL